MPKAIKKRIPKKKPVEENEVKGAMLQVLETVKERQKEVTIGAVAVLAVIILFVVFRFFSSSSYEKAYSIEMQANDYYYGAAANETMSGEERWKKAVDLYQESINVKLTPTALFNLGNCYFNLGDYEGAIEQYASFKNKFRGETVILPLVYQKLASSYFKTSQNDKAVEALGSLAGLEGGIFKDTALILEARHYESAGDKQKALEIYKQINEEYPSSLWSVEANAKISAEEAPKTESETEETSAGEPGSEVKEETVEKQTAEPGSE